MTNEENIALMEAECLYRMRGYFKPRSDFQRTIGRPSYTEKLFEDAFKRGWDARGELELPNDN